MGLTLGRATLALPGEALLHPKAAHPLYSEVSNFGGQSRGDSAALSPAADVLTSFFSVHLAPAASSCTNVQPRYFRGLNPLSPLALGGGLYLSHDSAQVLS